MAVEGNDRGMSCVQSHNFPGKTKKNHRDPQLGETASTTLGTNGNK